MNDKVEELPRATDPAAWTPEDITRSEAWRHAFTGREAAELLAAANDNAAGEGPRLPVLAPQLEQTAQELRSGVGFRVLRGFPVKELGKEGTAKAFMALSRGLGCPMEQPGGVELAHVRADAKGRKGFGFRAAGELPFHADLEDVIGFLCIRPASGGGTRRFASAVTVYNIMREEHPDELRVLMQPFHMALQQPHPDHGQKWTRLPFLGIRDQVFMACAYPVHIKRAQGLAGVPELTPAQTRALAAFNTVAGRVAVSMELQPGDVEYFNNHVVLHTRSEFSEDHGPGRHLLRVWLSMSRFRPLHEEHPISLRARTPAGEGGPERA